MKLSHVLSIFAIALAPLAYAQSDHMKGMDIKHGHEAEPHAAGANSHRASGLVKSVDAVKGTVSIAHGAIDTLKWPAMTMTFAVRDRKTLDNLHPGNKVRFEFVQEGSRSVITSLQRD